MDLGRQRAYISIPTLPIEENIGGKRSFFISLLTKTIHLVVFEANCSKLKILKKEDRVEKTEKGSHRFPRVGRHSPTTID